MNGLTLRISGGGGGGMRSRNSVGFQPVTLTFPTSGKQNTLIANFIQSSTADEQLTILKTILDGNKDSCDEETVRFLVVVFFQADPKHPVKCFLTRHITKNVFLQTPFSETLASELKCILSQRHSKYKVYVGVVSKVAACIENFPTGVAAVKEVELLLAEYQRSCLECCVGTLRDTNTPSPTEKNEIFNLAHLALRLLLYLVQKVSLENISNLTSMFKDIRVLLKELLFDDDVPMDTKSVCGILFLSMLVLENGPDSWVKILKPDQNDDELKQMLSNEAAELALSSALATVVSMDRLQCQIVDGESALLRLTTKILSIGDRSSSESTFILCVTRTLLQICKALGKVSDGALGLRLVEVLLMFAWPHLDHHMDSVRHLTAQALNCLVRYCSIRNEGADEALRRLFDALASLDRNRRSYYVCVTSLSVELGARRVIARVPDLIRDLIEAVSVQAVQASASTALETLLLKHVQESSSETIYQQWITPILAYVGSSTLDSTALNVLENLLTKAVALDEDIIDYILPLLKQSPTTQARDLKCVLMLLSVTRKAALAGTLRKAPAQGEWKGIISYRVLEQAAVDAVEETRILSLSLVAESRKTTEVFTREELSFLLHYLKYNMNAQSPNFRQLTLSFMKKFTKRFDESYKVLRRHRELASNEQYYLKFVEELRAQCFDSLVPGANYSRRFVALQLLTWCDQLHLDGYERIWTEHYVEKLLMHLEDSYESNKAFALEILQKCPTQLLKGEEYSISLEIEDILRQASSLKPTDCVSAAYKLDLLRTKLPDCVLQGGHCKTAEPVTYTLLRRLHVAMLCELAVCERSVSSAAARAPLYGLLHCMGHLVTRVHVSAISEDAAWSALVADTIAACVRACAAVACVVNNSSPEGHLPMDMSAVSGSDHDNSSLRLQDGSHVTAQMVLLCAWRTVKEVSLLLGEISSRFSIAGEGQPHGNLTPGQIELVGAHFTALLAETKHRGAFEQAYVGFTKLLARLWRCRSPALLALPRAWLAELMASLAAGERRATLSATRRSAGLPFMIQALVTTELEVVGNPKCFHGCMGTLLRLSRDAEGTETRAHCVHILRTLFRHAALHESVATHVADGLLVALAGFQGGTWMERNASTLLFSALMVRVFGVQRSRDAEQLCARNRMTGRIFFLRYPTLYDYMLEKLKEASSTEDTQELRPSLYPVLLLLARLYPSSLEGTVSNLKLAAFIPHVLACARSRVLKSRQLAARAMLPLVAPDQYIPHLEAMLNLICDKKIKRNYCHGILLQLVRLLDAEPDNLSIDREASDRLTSLVGETCWLLEQAAGSVPCYLIAAEYLKVVNLLLWRFPALVQHNMISKLKTFLDTLLFNDKEVTINSGREICLCHAIYLYFVILSKYDKENLCELVCKGLSHKTYEVILATLNYLLILYESSDNNDCKFQIHLSQISNKVVLTTLRENQIYIHLLCSVLKSNKYPECIQKTLRVLTLEKDTEKFIVRVKLKDTNTEITDEVILETLFDCIRNEHENLTHIYLESLSNFVNRKLKDYSINGSAILNVIRMIFACSSSDNSDKTRSVIVGFLEGNCEQLLKLQLHGLSDEEIFEYKCTIFATMATVLEDDDASVRQRASDLVSRLYLPAAASVVASRAAETLREVIASEGASILLVLALLDFRSEVRMTDEGNDECRVFDQNERYNIFLEETIWTIECADKIIHICNRNNQPHENVVEYIQTLLEHPVYKRTFEKLCNNNVILFKKILLGDKGEKQKNDVINPKIRLFINRLVV